MRIAKHLLIVALVAGLLPAGIAQAGNCGSSKAKLTGGHASADIVDTAVAAGKFNTLATALKKTDLVGALKSEGPFTVFAPTDEAFAKLPAGTLENLLGKPEQLKAILLYHVVPGRLMAKDVLKMNSAKTLLGQRASITAGRAVKIDNANITATDVMASNGVIHVIDSVILPDNDIIEVARGAGSFNTLLTAIDAAGLSDALRSDGPFTVFAPTDEAFSRLPKGTLDSLLANPDKLAEILKYHVVSGRVASSQVVNLTEARTLQGGKVRIDSSSGVKVDNARVIKTDVEATNGIIHVIDEVILPG